MYRNIFVLTLLILTVCLTGCFGSKSDEASNTSESYETAIAGQAVQETGAIAQPEEGIQEQPSVGNSLSPDIEEAASFTMPSNEDIQAALKKAGYYNGEIDGKLGPLSEAAIKEFQAANGLESDGKVGRKTWGLLKDYLLSAEE